MRDELRRLVSAAITDAMMRQDERWLSAQELCAQFQMFTPRWLKNHGDCLPRKRVTIKAADGSCHSTRWAYPQHEIAENIRNGMYDNLMVLYRP